MIKQALIGTTEELENRTANNELQIEADYVCTRERRRRRRRKKRLNQNLENTELLLYVYVCVCVCLRVRHHNTLET